LFICLIQLFNPFNSVISIVNLAAKNYTYIYIYVYIYHGCKRLLKKTNQNKLSVNNLFKLPQKLF